MAKVVSMEEEMKEVKNDLSLCKMVVAQNAVTTHSAPKVDVPKKHTVGQGMLGR